MASYRVVRNRSELQTIERQFRGIAMSIIVEFWEFLKVRKKFWLLPIFIVSVVFGGLVILT
jgi:Family of unknown function (DUF5989)